MTQKQRAQDFAELHQNDTALVLYNIWDAGSAATLAKSGTPAIATGSMGLAAAQGYTDGQQIPLDLLLLIVSRITETADLPVTVDFEGAYGETPAEISHNVTRLIKTGAIGLNFEDQIIGDADGALYPVSEQQTRITAVRQSADSAGIALFINARTDMFLKQPDLSRHASFLPDAISRAAAYKQAGANGFFVPGLADDDLIRDLCRAVDLPVNIMKSDAVCPINKLTSLGVRRISYGPFPYFAAMAEFENAYLAKIT